MEGAGAHRRRAAVYGRCIRGDALDGLRLPGQAEFGTYFIGYARNLWVIEQMLHNMFVGVPEGQHDRILDFSTATTGTTFFVPSNTILEGLGD